MGNSVQQRFGDFQLLSLLAKGGMAELFCARHIPTNQLVVIKRLLPELEKRPDVIEMFLTEADIGRMIVHDNIVRVLDAGEIEGQYFIVLEYVDGTDVERVLANAWEKSQPVPPDLVIRIGIDALRGLHAAHELTSPQGTRFGLVHRDVSPDNLFVTREGTTKVADFGIAKLAHIEGVTSTGLIKGKLTYMSPEQVNSQALDGRADLFSLALILFEMLSGNRPFAPYGGETEIDTLLRVRKGKVPRLASLEKELPRPITKIIDRSLRKWRWRRPKSCAAFAAELEFEAAKADLLATPQELARYIDTTGVW